MASAPHTSFSDYSSYSSTKVGGAFELLRLRADGRAKRLATRLAIEPGLRVTVDMPGNFRVYQNSGDQRFFIVVCAIVTEPVYQLFLHKDTGQVFRRNQQDQQQQELTSHAQVVKACHDLFYEARHWMESFDSWRFSMPTVIF